MTFLQAIEKGAEVVENTLDTTLDVAKDLGGKGVSVAKGTVDVAKKVGEKGVEVAKDAAEYTKDLVTHPSDTAKGETFVYLLKVQFNSKETYTYKMLYQLDCERI